MEADTKPRVSRLNILKNLGVASSSIALLCTGYDGLSSLQSTMNDEVGAAGQGLVYLMFCISTLFFTKYIIQKIGCKHSIILSQICYVPYIASNFYPRWITFVPSAMLFGVASATLWGGQSTYFNKASILYCSLKEQDFNQKHKISEPNHSSEKNSGVGVTLHSREQSSTGISSPDTDIVFKNGFNKCTLENPIQYNTELHGIVNARFFGWNSFFCKMAEVFSNLMSYFILKKGSQEISGDSSCLCGADFCHGQSQCQVGHLGGVPDDRRYLLSGLCVGLSVLAIVLLVMFLERIEERLEPVELSRAMLTATCKHLLKKEQILLTPLSLVAGLIEGFYTGEVTRAFIGCAMGTHEIGLVTICFGLFGAVSSTLSGWLVKYTGRVPVISFGIFASIGTCVLLLLWKPNASQPLVFFLIASLLGVSAGILWSQTPAFYGVLFKGDEEAAFAGFYTWDSLGRSLPFLFSSYLCTHLKIYFLIAMSFLGLLGYLLAERSFAFKKGSK